jgi:hypothetical protein
MEFKHPVAFFTGKFPLNEAKWFTEQVTSLIDLGVDVRIFAFHRGEARDVGEKILEYKLVDRTTYIEVPESRSRRLFLGLWYFFTLLLGNPRALGRLLVKRKDGGISYALKYLFWTAPLLGKIDQCPIVHCHFGMIANRYLIIKDILELKQPQVLTNGDRPLNAILASSSVRSFS